MGNGLREFVFGLSYGVETGDTILEYASLMLYYMVRNKEVFVADNMNWNSGVHWDISFTRSVNDWEVGFCSHFLVFYIHLKLLGLRKTGCVGPILVWYFSGLSPIIGLLLQVSLEKHLEG